MDVRRVYGPGFKPELVLDQITPIPCCAYTVTRLVLWFHSGIGVWPSWHYRKQAIEDAQVDSWPVAGSVVMQCGLTFWLSCAALLVAALLQHLRPKAYRGHRSQASSKKTLNELMGELMGVK